MDTTLGGLRVLEIRPLQDHERPQVGELLAATFPDKVAAKLPRHTAAAATLFADLAAVTPLSWVAVEDDRVAGVLYLRDRSIPVGERHHWRVLRRHLPFGAALRAAAFGLVFYSVRLPPDCLYIETVAVRPELQGRGIAGALIRHAVAEALRRGKRAVRLYCIERNVHARAVYEHHGFTVVKREHLWPFAALLGFRVTSLMELRL